jgi:HSF-type DNA-binding
MTQIKYPFYTKQSNITYSMVKQAINSNMATTTKTNNDTDHDVPSSTTSQQQRQSFSSKPSEPIETKTSVDDGTNKEKDELTLLSKKPEGESHPKTSRNDDDDNDDEKEEKDDDEDDDDDDMVIPTTTTGEAAASTATTTDTLKMNTGLLPFPENLMSLLDSQKVSDIIRWLPDGDAFCLIPSLFAEHVLDKYFQGTKFESFTRKLNRWYVMN